MLYLGNLLKKYINVNDKPENIGLNLTLKTCEVENVIYRKIPDTVVIGKVKKVEKHPNADKLFVCEIDCGKHGVYQIITGGENIVKALGRYVPIALPGTYLPAVDLKIVARPMRGIESNGMICSKSELGIPEDEDKHWIWILDEDLSDLTDSDVGKSLKEKYPWLENWILDVDNKTITHRPDLTGHFGLAVELNAIYENDKILFNKVKDYFKQFDNTNIFEVLQGFNKSNKKVNVSTDKCFTYLLVELDNVTVRKSDFFLRVLMYDLGLNPNNNWVDFSNIFMYLSGQPIHFFDADKVKGNIIVRQAVQGEEFVDLFGNKHILTEDDIVIADEEKILALAGVIGGENSGITKDTKKILVEIANFDPISIRKTGIRLGLRTDAQLRFEKNISPLWSLYALLLFLDELKYFTKDLGDFEIKGLDYYYDDNILKFLNKQVEIDYNDMTNFICGNIKEGFKSTALEILKNLGFKPKSENIVIPPIWRSPADINLPEDVYEEVARIYGYENIEGREFKGPIKYVEYLDFVKFNREIEDVFVRDLHFDQIETYPWIDEEVLDIFGVDKNSLVSLINPTAPKYKYLRNTLFFSFLDVLTKNFRHFENIRIFEVGKIWNKVDNVAVNSWDIENLKKYSLPFYVDNIEEKTKIGFLLYRKKSKNWQEDVLVEAKKYISVLLRRLEIKGKKTFVRTSSKWFHPIKQGEIILNGQKIGFIGQLHPIWYDFFKFKENSQILYCELDFSILLKLRNSQKKGIKVSSYDTLSDQILWKDISFLIKKDKEYGKLVDAVKKIKEIEDVKVFDLYIGENIPDDMKSISLSVKIKGDNLTSEEINRILQKIIKEAEKFGAKLR